jgi:nickel-dependent lactate racemase
VAEGRLFAVRDNPVRAQIDEVGIRAGLRFIVNEVPGSGDSAGELFAGDPILAHRQACDFARSSCSVRIPEAADIVLADSFPSDLDFWQSMKGLNAACSAVKPGGTVVLVTPCHEGVSREHPELLSVGFRKPIEEIETMVSDGRIDRVVAAAIWLGTQMAARARVILVSAGVSEAETRRMGFDFSPTPSLALATAVARHGPDSRVTILNKSAKMICDLPPETS